MVDARKLNEARKKLLFIPQKGPQTAAFMSKADLCLYGGAAGGGKTALAIGLTLTQHRESLFVRRESKQLDGVLMEYEDLLNTRNGYNGQSGVWRIPQFDGVKRRITFGSVPYLGDERRYMGRPRDLLVADEAANLIESQIRFLMGWVRTTVPNQRTRTLLCSNPPTNAEGEWMIRMFAPWVDPSHPNPALPGELRWYTTIAGEDVEVEDGNPITIHGETITPLSRTFIPAKVTDNKYLVETGYMAHLQALPEPLRSQMLYGDFTAGREDDEYQVIPSEWIKRAQERWYDREHQQKEITGCGVDPSRGGRDSTIIATRCGWHFNKLIEMKGEETDTGGKVAERVVKAVGESMCGVHVDVIGIGSSVLDHLEPLIGSRAIPVNFASRDDKEVSIAGDLHFANERARMYWRFRELLDPSSGVAIALPPDATLFSDLCAPTYKLTPSGILLESKADIKKRLGRSPDKGDAVVCCAERSAVISLQTGPRIRAKGSLHGQQGSR